MNFAFFFFRYNSNSAFCMQNAISLKEYVQILTTTMISSFILQYVMIEFRKWKWWRLSVWRQLDNRHRLNSISDFLSPLTLSSMACIMIPPRVRPYRQCHTLKRPTLDHASLLSWTYTIGTASTRDTAYSVHFCWLTVSPSGVSESTSQRGRTSKLARDPTWPDRSRIDLARYAYALFCIRGVSEPQDVFSSFYSRCKDDF